MISSLSSPTMPMVQSAAATQVDATAGGQETASTQRAEKRPPPPPPPPSGGEEVGSADTEALVQSLFEVLESDESSEETSLLDTFTTSASDGYSNAQSIFAS